MSNLAVVEHKLIVKEAGLPLRAGSSLREAEGGGQVREVVIISEGWGSSGYYSGEVLKRDIPRIFPVGTHMYLNHPTEREDMERPERSVADLVGKLISTPRPAGIDMVAEALVYEHWEEVIAALAEDIGLSIRAFGIAEEGSAGGRKGPVIKALTEGHSVDYVTKAGAGGKIGQKIESARESCPAKLPIEEKRNALNWLESRIHREFTYLTDNLFGEGYLNRDERIILSEGIGLGLKSFASHVEKEAPQLLNRDPYDDPDGTETEVEENKKREQIRERQKKEHKMEVDDREFADLKESVKTLQAKDVDRDKEVKEAETKTQEANDRADRAEEALRLSRANTVAREAVKEKFPKLPESAQTRAVESSLRDKLPLTEDKKLDESTFKSRAEKAAEDEANYLAEAGGGEVSDFGASESGDRKDNPEGGKALKEAEERLQKRFEDEGMSEAAAKAAAKGR